LDILELQFRTLGQRGQQVNFTPKGLRMFLGQLQGFFGHIGSIITHYNVHFGLHSFIETSEKKTRPSLLTEGKPGLGAILDFGFWN
jgi:hypothetical protein